jgi:DNA (cytosine-5)-methyltransferase 1
MDFIRIVDEIKPRFFIMENVKGLLSAPIRHRPHARRGLGFPQLEPDEMPGAALQVILAEMKRIGYEVVYALLNTADYGVPQVRERVIFIGYKGDNSVTLPLPNHSQKGTDKQPKWLTLRED